MASFLLGAESKDGCYLHWLLSAAAPGFPHARELEPRGREHTLVWVQFLLASALASFLPFLILLSLISFCTLFLNKGLAYTFSRSASWAGNVRQRYDIDLALLLLEFLRH